MLSGECLKGSIQIKAQIGSELNTSRKSDQITGAFSVKSTLKMV